MRRMLAVACLGACLAGPEPAAGQQRGPLPGLSGDLTPAEVQQMFDAFELVRAREMLDLSDEQYPQFVVKLQALQQMRRETQTQRQRLLRELQQLANRPNTDDDELWARLEAFKTHDRESEVARSAAQDEIDAVLNVRQQVRFRIFEQAMERRRLDLLMRVRRPVQRRPGQQQR